MFLMTAGVMSSAGAAQPTEPPTNPSETCDLFSSGIENFNANMPVTSPDGVTITSAKSQLVPGKYCLITIRASIPDKDVVQYAHKKSGANEKLVKVALTTRPGQDRLKKELLEGIRVNFMNNRSFATMFKAGQKNLALGVNIDFPGQMNLDPVGAVYSYDSFLALQNNG